MGVLGSLSRGIGVLQRNPVIVGLVFAYSLLSTGLAALNAVNPLLVLVGYAVLLFVVPFYLGGIIGSIEDGLDGAATASRFVSAGASNYLPMLGGSLVLGVLSFVVYVVVLIVGFIAAIFVLGAGSMAGLTSASVVVLALGGLLGFVVIMLPWFLLQFFPAAIVVDDLGLVDSFKRSAGIVKRNFLSVLGFDVLAFLVSLIAQVPTVYLLAVAETPSTAPGTTDQPAASPADQMAGQTVFDTLSTTELGIYLGSFLVLGTIVYAVSHAFYVAYYDQLPR